MKPPHMILIWLIAGMTGLLTAGVAEGAAPRPPSALAGVKALEKPVTFTETKIPLGELVQKVAAGTGVTLVASPEVADEPVAVVVKDLPARELLVQLAELLDYMWSRRGKEGDERYEIWQDLAAKNREEALRRAALADSERRLRDEVGQHAAMARRTPEEIQALKEEGERREQEFMKLPPEQQQAFLSSPEGRAWAERYRAATAVATPIPRALAGSLARLTLEQWAALRAGQTLIFSSDPQPGELALPAETTGLLRASPLPDGPPGVRQEPVPLELESRTQQVQDAMRRSWAAAAGYRVGLRLDVEQFEASGGLMFTANAAPLGGPADPFQFGPGTELMLVATPLDSAAQAAGNTPVRRAAWARDPVLSRKESFKPAAQPQTAGFGPRFGPHQQFRDLLPELARVYGAQFISDAYWPTGLRSGPQSPPTPVPLYQVLEESAGFFQQWDRKGDLIRLRSRTWFFERPREIPLRYVRQWRESYEKEGGLSFAQYLEMVKQLRDIQLRHLPHLTMVGALPPTSFELHSAYEGRHALRLYARLTDSQKQALLAEKPLRLSELRPPERELFVRAVRELQRTRPTRATATPPDWENASLAVSTRRVDRFQDPLGSPRFLRTEPPPAATGPAPAPPVVRQPPPGAAGGPPPFRTRLPGLPGFSPPRSTARRPTEQTEFIFQLGPQHRQTVSVSTVAAAPASEQPAPSPPAPAP